MPHSATCVHVLDPETQRVTPVGPPLGTAEVFKFAGAVLAPDGRVWALPALYQTSLLVVDPGTSAEPAAFHRRRLERAFATAVLAVGQTKEIHIVRLAFKDSVEHALCQMHDARANGEMAEGVASPD